MSGLDATRAVLADVEAERVRQVELGFDAAHDDDHSTGDLISLAWSQLWAAEPTRRRALVKAAALLVAAIERHDRAVARGTVNGDV